MFKLQPVLFIPVCTMCKPRQTKPTGFVVPSCSKKHFAIYQLLDNFVANSFMQTMAAPYAKLLGSQGKGVTSEGRLNAARRC